MFGPVKASETLTFAFVEYDTITAPVSAIKEKDGDEIEEGVKIKVIAQLSKSILSEVLAFLNRYYNSQIGNYHY